MRNMYIIVVEYATRKFNHGIEEVMCLDLLKIAEVGARIIEHCRDVLLNLYGATT